MKINLKDRTTQVSIILAACVIIPILYHQIEGLITGKYSAYLQSLPKTVQVMNPEETEITPEINTTGRVDAKESINVIARINGWLKKVYFTEGDLVKKGQVLYEIEPDEYIYAMKTAKATVNENQAVFYNSQLELNRAKALLKDDFVSQEYYDNAVSKRNKDRAALDGSIEQYNKAKLNLSYTKIYAPMDGRIGKIEISAGNYVDVGAGALTSIYSTNPMRVIFTAKSGDFIQLKKFMRQGTDSLSSKSALPVNVYLKLSDGEMYDQVGKIEYFDNKIDETTGSVTLRAEFANPKEILVHGDFVNVIIKGNQKEKVMTIPQSATKTDVGTGYYVWVVKDNKTEKRDIVVKNSFDNKWIVEKGLNYDDVVIVKGIQDIYHSGQKVKTEPFVPDKNETKEAK